MKVVFMGTPEFASICLQEIIKSQHEVVGVVSVADKPAGRGQKLMKSSVAKFADDENLLLLQPTKLSDPSFIEELSKLQADAFVVVAFRMLPKEVWRLPPKGTFNLHASLLPQYRGAAPINWAIINGETKSGVTTFLIDEKIDTGNVLLQRSVEISPDENAGMLHDALADLGKKLIVETLDGLENNTIHPRIQDDILNLKPAPKIFKEDCKINWYQPLPVIHNKIRGLSPYPTAWTNIEKEGQVKSIKIFKGSYEEDALPHLHENRITFDNNEMRIHHKNGYYLVRELQIEGKKRMTDREFINGIQDKLNWKVVD